MKQIFLPNKCIYHDVDVTIFNYKLGQIPLFPDYFYVNHTLLKFAILTAKKLNIHFTKGLIITGDTFLNDHKSKKRILKYFSKSIAIDMESCAIAQTAFMFKVPLLIIKFISDFSDKNSKQDFSQSFFNHSKKIAKILSCIFLYFNHTMLKK